MLQTYKIKSAEGLASLLKNATCALKERAQTPGYEQSKHHG